MKIQGTDFWTKGISSAKLLREKKLEVFEQQQESEPRWSIRNEGISVMDGLVAGARLQRPF